jgi:multisubunit Na+/H+ antiporter MnhG subunit
MSRQEWKLLRPFVAFVISGLVACVAISCWWVLRVGQAQAGGMQISAWDRFCVTFTYGAIALLALGVVFTVSCHAVSILRYRRLSGGSWIANSMSGIALAGVLLLAGSIRITEAIHVGVVLCCVVLAAAVSSMAGEKARKEQSSPDSPNFRNVKIS